MFLESFKELTEEELEKLYQKIKEFQQKEKEWENLIQKLPKGNILAHTSPEFDEYHKWMLRDGYYSFKAQYGTRFARKIARELIYDKSSVI